MEASDFADLPVPSRHTIEVTRFIDLADIEPVYYEKSYMLEPDKVGEKPYYLLVSISEQELAMANMLIDQLAGGFEPEQYRDEYRAALEKVVEAKLESREPDFAAPAPVMGKVTDLMEALRASIEAAKAASQAREAEAPGARPAPEEAVVR